MTGQANGKSNLVHIWLNMKCKDRGVTLIETLVVVTILSVLALSLYTVFKTGVDVWSRSESRLEIYQGARAVLDQLSRELVGAFAGGDAKLEGVAGATAADPDTLAFITEFGDSIYKIKYYLDTTDPDNKVLKRDYIDYGVAHVPAKDYTSTIYDASIDLVSPRKGTMVENIKFAYLPLMASPTGLSDWSSAMPAWPGGEPADSLPEALKIVITMKDASGASRSFETIVYLPGSEL